MTCGSLAIFSAAATTDEGIVAGVPAGGAAAWDGAPAGLPAPWRGGELSRLVVCPPRATTVVRTIVAAVRRAFGIVLKIMHDQRMHATRPLLRNWEGMSLACQPKLALPEVHPA